MASIKVLLWDKKNKDGLYPIAIRIIKDRKPSYIYLGHYIEKTQWDEENKKVRKSHPNSARLNNLISKKVAEANGKLIDLETNNNDTSSQAIKSTIKSKTNASFFVHAETYIDNLRKAGKYNQVVSEQPRINNFKTFLKDQDITFQEITVTLLNRFRAYLKSKKRKVGERTVINHFILIRTIFNQAIADHLVDAKYYPFGKGKISIKFPDSLKIGLTAEEVKKIEDLELPDDSILHHVRNVWLFSFYFAGMRASDVLRLRWSDFQNDRLYYTMGKNSKGGSLKVPEKALQIMQIYKDAAHVHGLLFPELQVVSDLNDLYEVQRKTSYAIKKLDKYLKTLAEKAKVEKPVTMHISRHSFGNISGEKISLQMLQKLYRHSSITTTIGYQTNFIHKDADEALDAVVGF